jgi:hypothetical protein
LPANQNIKDSNMKMLLKLNEHDNSMVEAYSPDKDYLLCIMHEDAFYLMRKDKSHIYANTDIYEKLTERLLSGEEVIVSLHIEL